MITIAISDLKPALAGLAKVVSNKSTLECLRCVRVDATPEKTTLTGTDLDMNASITLPEAQCDMATSFLLPLDRLQAITRRLTSRSSIYLEEGKITFDLGTGRVCEPVDAPELKEFPEEPAFEINTVALPEAFSRRFTEAMGCSSTDSTRYVLNGVQLDVSDSASHYMVGTDGRHLFSANTFVLPLSDSVTIPNHKIFMWRGLAAVPWALASQRKDDPALVRIAAGNWTLTMKAIDGNYPNWRQVVPKPNQHRTVVTLPDKNGFTKIVNGLPGGDLKDKPVDLVITNRSVSVKDPMGGRPILLIDAKAKGPNVTTRVNRDYLSKALDYGLTSIGLIDGMSPLHFSHEGRQMVVMPLRLTDVSPTEVPTTQPAPEESESKTTAQPEPQPERTMTETNGHTNGAATSRLNGAIRSTTPTAEKPAIEVAIEKIDSFKATFRETLVGMTELTTLLKQSIRDQKAGEKEIHQVRQTLRSLQSVKI